MKRWARKQLVVIKVAHVARVDEANFNFFAHTGGGLAQVRLEVKKE